MIASALLSTVGVFLALLVTRTTFNLSSFMGLIMVIGIVAKNGILLLDADQRFRAEGLSAEESMIRAGERRLRPIMMTALATVAGMIPLALGWGAGSQMLQPLAIAVIGGIVASMVLSLVITPAVHYYLADRRRQECARHRFSPRFFAFFLLFFFGLGFGARACSRAPAPARWWPGARPAASRIRGDRASSKSITVWCSLTSTSVPGP